MESTAHIGHYSWDGIDYQLFFPDKKTNLEFYEPVDYEYVHREQWRIYATLMDRS